MMKQGHMCWCDSDVTENPAYYNEEGLSLNYCFALVMTCFLWHHLHVERLYPSTHQAKRLKTDNTVGNNLEFKVSQALASYQTLFQVHQHRNFVMSHVSKEMQQTDFKVKHNQKIITQPFPLYIVRQVSLILCY